jgi:hypothetical protein
MTLNYILPKHLARASTLFNSIGADVAIMKYEGVEQYIAMPSRNGNIIDTQVMENSALELWPQRTETQTFPAGEGRTVNEAVANLLNAFERIARNNQVILLMRPAGDGFDVLKPSRASNTDGPTGLDEKYIGVIWPIKDNKPSRFEPR